ncbi:MAG: hypothetical protein FWD23_04170 [Oscillospiraceae bacterium]|nr:hypothetical protein [Oscillospiraceae bacterium]
MIFDYSFLENGMLPAGLVNTVAAIAELRERDSLTGLNPLNGTEIVIFYIAVTCYALPSDT